MNSRILLFIGSMTMAVILMSSITYTMHSPGGKSNSPGDGASCTSCHAGSPQTVSNWISSNIPATGYVPGTNYTITVTGTHTGVAKFGFELSAEDANNTKMGNFSITNSTETDLTNSMHAVTHTGNGVTPSNDSKSWSFDWVAPAAGSGEITFYASLNAANGNNAASGDVIYNTSKAYSENLNIGISEPSLATSFRIYPNPVQDILKIENSDHQKYDINILDLVGKTILTQSFDEGIGTQSIDISNLAQGAYFIQIQSNNAQFTQQIIKP